MQRLYTLLTRQNFAVATCGRHSSLFSFPTWYEYLPGTGTPCHPILGGLSDIWLIVAAVIDILLRVAALIAFGVLIFAGFQYMTSQGNPQSTSKALSTLISAIVGLIICVLASILVSFIAGSIK